MKRPEVAVDYRDLDYTGELEFVPELEQGLKNTRVLLQESQRLIQEQNTVFQQAVKDKKGDAEMNKILEKIRSTKQFQAVQQQSGIMKAMDSLK